MNERIRELSYEAQRYALNNTTGPDLAGLNELWQEKFAELIVRECAERLLNDAKLTDIQTTRCVASIREHFSVDK